MLWHPFLLASHYAGGVVDCFLVVDGSREDLRSWRSCWMAPPESLGARSLTNELNVQMNGASTDLSHSHETYGVLGFWGNIGPKL